MLLLPEKMRAYSEDVARLIEEEKYNEAARLTSNLSDGRAAQILSEAHRDDVLPFLQACGRERAAQIIAELPLEFASEILTEADVDTATEWLSMMPADVATDIVEELPDYRAEVLLERLPDHLSQAVERLSRHEEGTAGAMMTPYFSAIPQGKTVKEAIEAVRAAPTRLTSTGYLYVVDENRRLRGVLSNRDLLLAAQSAKIDTIMKRDVLVARVDDDDEEIAQRIRSRRLKMMPVVSPEEVLVGVITMEDAMELLSYELADDMSGIGAVSPDEGFFTPPSRAIRMRLPWMAANVFLNLGAVTIITGFEATIEQVAILAAFLPMITDMGGNVGIQALSVSIRSIALGESRVRDYWAALRKELLIGLFNGAALGLLFGVIAYLYEFNTTLAAVAGFALAVNVVLAGVIGGTMPFLIKRMGYDPAMMTGPILTTITDITGVTIYLGLSTIFLAGLLAAG